MFIRNGSVFNSPAASSFLQAANIWFILAYATGHSLELRYFDGTVEA